MSFSARQKAEEFLKTKELYLLGDLTTEKPHPLTTQLSQHASKDLPQILSTVKKIELKLVTDVLRELPLINELQADIERTIKEGRRIFISGCGATGRLAMTLEFLWRKLAPSDLRDRVVGFMAGGDVALVRSLERIEDRPDMGAQHLMSLKFDKQDLLIAVTEGGETPYVIGTVEKALQYGRRPPYFLFCNSKKLLCDKVERSQKIIENKHVNSIALNIDPMVLAGSTRLQATTALLLAIGSALFPQVTIGSPQSTIHDYLSEIEKLDFLDLIPFIEAESATYLKDEKTLYVTDELGITILTDTTERSPTFSLAPFENMREKSEPSLTYLKIKNVSNSHEAWQNLLLRPPRLDGRPDWIEEKGVDWIYGYDFSRTDWKDRTPFEIDDHSSGFSFAFRGLKHSFRLSSPNLFIKHLVLKVLLNTHSTLLMGRLGRYHNNIMTWVKPSCGKLVDRAVRNIQFILAQEGLAALDYDELARLVFESMEGLKPTESIVLKVVEKVRNSG